MRGPQGAGNGANQLHRFMTAFEPTGPNRLGERRYPDPLHHRVGLVML
jgi:hypothetical protein